MAVTHGSPGCVVAWSLESAEAQISDLVPLRLCRSVSGPCFSYLASLSAGSDCEPFFMS